MPTDDDINLDLLSPAQADWWESRGKALRPTVLIVCGKDGCRNKVGDVRLDEEIELAVINHRHGERTVPYTPRHTEETLGLPPGVKLPKLAEQQDGKFEKLDKETLRYLPDARRVAGYYNAGDTVFPLDTLCYIVCPDHGMIEFPDATATVEQLREFLADTDRGAKRRWLAWKAIYT